MSQISSSSNPNIKQVRLLRKRKNRQESGLLVVEGIHPVGEAAEAASQGCRIESIFYAPDLLKSDFATRLIQQLAQQGTQVYPVTREVFASIADKENPQGILALVRPRFFDLNELNQENFEWGVALVAPQDPGNIGTVLRTIDAVGASGLILLEDSADPYHPNVVRASMGTLFWNPIVQVSFREFAHWARAYEYMIYGASAHGSLDYSEVERYTRPAILLLGSEREGLSKEQAAICDFMLRLPMRGRASSLNLAVAAGILLYAMLEHQ